VVRSSIVESHILLEIFKKMFVELLICLDMSIALVSLLVTFTLVIAHASSAIHLVCCIIQSSIPSASYNWCNIFTCAIGAYARVQHVGMDIQLPGYCFICISAMDWDDMGPSWYKNKHHSILPKGASSFQYLHVDLSFMYGT
jgi:hypothetical protein